ncbi:MAG: hypothetical protein COB74_09680 [Shewanella sp.]|nr:MAG: hypothetical protein COB74_09680 [Shewanella sp.]
MMSGASTARGNRHSSLLRLLITSCPDTKPVVYLDPHGLKCSIHFEDISHVHMGQTRNAAMMPGASSARGQSALLFITRSQTQSRLLTLTHTDVGNAAMMPGASSARGQSAQLFITTLDYKLSRHKKGAVRLL